MEDTDTKIKNYNRVEKSIKIEDAQDTRVSTRHRGCSTESGKKISNGNDE